MALLPGYTEFKGLDGSGDVGVAIFSYRLPPDVEGMNGAAIVARQIESGSCHRPVTRDALEVQLRCQDVAGAFDEYRVRVNPKTRRVTVMSGGFDSEVEIAHYERFAAMFRKHAESQ